MGRAKGGGRGCGGSDYTTAFRVTPLWFSPSGRKIYVHVISRYFQPCDNPSFFLKAFYNLAQFGDSSTTNHLVEALQEPEWLYEDVISYEDESPLQIPNVSTFISGIREVTIAEVDRAAICPPFNMRTRLSVALRHLPFEIVDLICSFCDAQFILHRIREGGAAELGIWEVTLTDSKWASHLRQEKFGSYGGWGSGYFGSCPSRYRAATVDLSWHAMAHSSYFTSRYRMTHQNDYPSFDPWERVRILRPLCMYSRNCAGAGGHLTRYRHVEDADPLSGSVVLALPERICNRVETLGGKIDFRAAVPQDEGHPTTAQHPVEAWKRCVSFDSEDDFAIRRRTSYSYSNGTGSTSSEILVPFKFCSYQQPEEQDKGEDALLSVTPEIPQRFRDSDRFFVVGFGPSVYVFGEIEPLTSQPNDPAAICLNDRNAGLPKTNFQVVVCHLMVGPEPEETDIGDFLARLSDNYHPVTVPFDRFSSVSDCVVRDHLSQEPSTTQEQQGQQGFHVGIWGIDQEAVDERKRELWSGMSDAEKETFSEEQFWQGHGRQRMEVVWKGIGERAAKRRKLQ